MRISPLTIGKKIRRACWMEGDFVLLESFRIYRKTNDELEVEFTGIDETGQQYTGSCGVDQDFELYVRKIDTRALLTLGSDLVLAIENADPSVLRQKTIHMNNAIEAWKDAVRRA